MNIYLCACYNLYQDGANDKVYFLVKCETKSVALGLCLENYYDTRASEWTIEELKLKPYEILDIEEA